MSVEIELGTSIWEKLVIKLMKAKVCVFSESVLCVGKCVNTPNRTLIGETSWSVSRAPINPENWVESMEYQRSSSG